MNISYSQLNTNNIKNVNINDLKTGYGTTEEEDEDEDLKVGDKVKIEKSYITVPIDGAEWKKQIDTLRGKVGAVSAISKHGMATVKFGNETIELHKGHLTKV